MNRRAFNRSAAGGLLAAFTHPRLASASFAPEEAPASRNVPYKLSVMLWTVFRDLPFDQRLEKVAEAGYKNIELVGEYDKWTSDDFVRFNAKRKQLGITFDCTAGLKHSLTNPAEREVLMGDIRNTLGIMERLDCPALILLSGNVVPGMSVEAQQRSCIDGLKAAAQLVNGKKID